MNQASGRRCPTPIILAVRRPNRHEAAVRQLGDGRIFLLICDVSVNLHVRLLQRRNLVISIREPQGLDVGQAVLALVPIRSIYVLDDDRSG